MEHSIDDRDIGVIKAAVKATPACLPIDKLCSLLHEPRDSDPQLLAAAHVAACVHCSIELRLLGEFEFAHPRAGEAAAVDWIATRLLQRVSARASFPPAIETDRDAGRRAWWSVMFTPRFISSAVLATATGLLLISAILYRRRPMEPKLASSPVVAEVQRSTSVVALGPSGELARRPATIRWREFAGASSYRIRLMEVDRTELWSADAAGSEIVIPESVRSRIIPGKTLLWEVTARSTSGSEISSSGLQRFVLKLNK